MPSALAGEWRESADQGKQYVEFVDSSALQDSGRSRRESDEEVHFEDDAFVPALPASSA